MMKHVEQNQMRKAAAAERQFVTVTYDIKPGIGKEVSADGARQMSFQVADTGADFDDAPRDVGVQKRDDSFVEAGVDAAQQRLVLPGLEVALDFRLVLGERRAHALSAPIHVIRVSILFLPVRLFSIAAWLP